MKKSWFKLVIPLVSVFFILSACSAGQNGQKENVAHGISGTDNHDVHPQNINNPDIIPSIDSAKKKTTNEHGGTTEGMGSNVYSLIGSSGLHDGGISSHLESRLSGEGINGIEVFVLDDSIILARAKNEVTSNQYDPMQDKVLTGTNDTSGQSKMKTGEADEGFTDDNMEQAKKYMSKVFNGHVKIFTVTDPKAVDLIERIKSNLTASSIPYDKISADITTLLKMTSAK